MHLVSGHNLVAMDKSGTSDPYVKFKQASRLLFKSKIVHKELNPTFDETFFVPIEDPFQPISVKVRILRSFFAESQASSNRERE